MAIAKTTEEMITRSIYIERNLYEQLQKSSKRIGASIVISHLVKMWLDGKIRIELEPKE